MNGDIGVGTVLFLLPILVAVWVLLESSRRTRRATPVVARALAYLDHQRLRIAAQEAQLERLETPGATGAAADEEYERIQDRMGDLFERKSARAVALVERATWIDRGFVAASLLLLIVSVALLGSALS